MELFHFSHDPRIGQLAPHVPPTNPEHEPAVWAIDAEHAPLYWFQRDCPRVTAWPRNDAEQATFREAFTTTASRVHAIELGWLSAMSTTVLYRYRFDAATFRPWAHAAGQWISDRPVDPIGVEAVGDLLELHVDGGIELRAVPSLWPLRDLAVSDRWAFSIVRFANAQSG